MRTDSNILWWIKDLRKTGICNSFMIILIYLLIFYLQYFHDCSCIPSSNTSIYDLPEQHQIAKSGICEEECPIFYVFMFLFLIMCLCTFICATAGQAASLRWDMTLLFILFYLLLLIFYLFNLFILIMWIIYHKL